MWLFISGNAILLLIRYLKTAKLELVHLASLGPKLIQPLLTPLVDIKQVSWYDAINNGQPLQRPGANLELAKLAKVALVNPPFDRGILGPFGVEFVSKCVDIAECSRVV